jgi:hypothetical protein
LIDEDWIRVQQVALEQHKENLSDGQTEATAVQARVDETCSRIRFPQEEITVLENALARSVLGSSMISLPLTTQRTIWQDWNKSNIERKRKSMSHLNI